MAGLGREHIVRLYQLFVRSLPIRASVGNEDGGIDLSKATTDRPDVVVETWVTGFAAGRWRALPRATRVMHSQEHPHVYARSVATENSVVVDVIHSTSWRMVGEQVVLTYVVVTSDDLGTAAFNIHRDHDHRRSGTTADHVWDIDASDATAFPGTISDLDVLHHALHHLALLARTNPSIMTSLDPAALAALRPLAPAGAGVLPAIGVA